jgi:hypothetical protein
MHFFHESLETLIYLSFQVRQNITSVQQSNRIAIANTECELQVH